MVPWLRVLGRIVALVVVLQTVADARPDEPIVVVASDAGFASALDDALGPAGMDVVTIGTRASPSLTELSTRSRELADAHQASATVWLLPAPAGATLVTYDRTVDRLLVRELPYRSPLSAPHAAEVARMVRTMLRALRMTSEDVTPSPRVAPRVPPAPWLAANVALGAWFAPPGDNTALATTGTVAWRPHGLGAAVTGVIAPAADVTSVTFNGQVRDLVLAAEARYALEVAPALRIIPAAGLGLHFVRLHGSFQGSDLGSRRWNPAVRVGVSGSYALPRGIDAGLAVSADCLLRRQRYEAGTEEILVIPRLQILTGIYLGMRL
jgi:hypothetical protein